MREAEAELEGVTWQPQISRMAKALKRPGDEERWNYLARTAIHKNKVGCQGQPTSALQQEKAAVCLPHALQLMLGDLGSAGNAEHPQLSSVRVTAAQPTGSFLVSHGIAGPPQWPCAGGRLPVTGVLSLALALVLRAFWGGFRNVSRRPRGSWRMRWSGSALLRPSSMRARPA